MRVQAFGRSMPPSMPTYATLSRGRAQSTAVQVIMDAVRERGDAAVREFSARFDGVQLHDLRVSAEEMATARQQVEPALIESLQQARKNLERFHRQQLPQEQVHELQPGVRTGRLWRPIEKVGLYAAGGKAPYPSTVLMLGVPALVAGCDQRVLCIPPSSEGHCHPPCWWLLIW